MSELVHRMHSQLRSWEQADDDRAIFLSCYALMTENMLRRAEEGGFEDGHWVLGLTHRFADYYFDALTCYESRQSPPVWHRAFDLACARRTPVLKNLLLGVNAHICYDLIFALSDSIHGEWCTLSADQRALRHRDFTAVNDVIGETLDAVQDWVVKPRSRAMAIVDTAFLRLDEWMLHTLIARWREQVWRDAIAYIDAPEEERSALQRAYAQDAERRAQAIEGQLGLLGIVEIF